MVGGYINVYCSFQGDQRQKNCKRQEDSLPHAVVCPLPQQLYGRLGTIHLASRHVQVIHKYDTLLAKRWSKYSLPPLVQFGHDDILCVHVSDA